MRRRESCRFGEACPTKTRNGYSLCLAVETSPMALVAVVRARDQRHVRCCRTYQWQPMRSCWRLHACRSLPPASQFRGPAAGSRHAAHKPATIGIEAVWLVASSKSSRSSQAQQASCSRSSGGVQRASARTVPSIWGRSVKDGSLNSADWVISPSVSGHPRPLTGYLGHVVAEAHMAGREGVVFALRVTMLRLRR